MGIVFVSEQLGNDSNPGSQALPFMSIAAAISSPANNIIYVLDGIYTGVIDSNKFDRVRRKIIGIGDVYFAAQGNSSCFTKPLRNNHLFKNIKFCNYTNTGITFTGGSESILRACFFKAFQVPTTSAISIAGAAALDINKCTIINNFSIFSIDPALAITNLVITNLSNTLMYGHTLHILNGPFSQTFSLFLTNENDLGNYYDNNIHLLNGGINSTTGENPPLFVDPSNGNYDLLPNSTLVGAGYLGSDIGSFHEFVPYDSSPEEPISIFDPGWGNDNSYYNIMTKSVGPDGPSDATGILQATINDILQWILDLATVPTGKSGRLLSPVADLGFIRIITRASWSAIENLTLPSGQRQSINNSNLSIATLEIRGSTSPFESGDDLPSWTSFTKTTAINLSARYVQVRIVFRLDGV